MSTRIACSTLHDVDAHAAGSAFDALDGGFEREAIQVRHLDLGDLLDLLMRDLPNLGLVRLGRAPPHREAAADQHTRGARPGDETAPLLPPPQGPGHPPPATQNHS